MEFVFEDVDGVGVDGDGVVDVEWDGVGEVVEGEGWGDDFFHPPVHDPALEDAYWDWAETIEGVGIDPEFYA